MGPPSQKREGVDHLREQFSMSLRHACRLLKLSPSVYYYQAKPRDDTAVISQLEHLAEHHPAWGFWKMYRFLREQGHRWNHKRVYRIYTAMRLNHRRRHKKRLPARVKVPMARPIRPNLVWSMDFMADTLVNGRRFRTLNIIDDYNREALVIEIDTSIRSQRVVSVLDRLLQWRGCPEVIRVDNGPEFMAEAVHQWAAEKGVALCFIQPGKPTQNALIERFNRTYREAVLDRYLFEDLHQVRRLTEEWIYLYNNVRPQASLLGMTPRQFLARRWDGAQYPTLIPDHIAEEVLLSSVPT